MSYYKECINPKDHQFAVEDVTKDFVYKLLCVRCGMGLKGNREEKGIKDV